MTLLYRDTLMNSDFEIHSLIDGQGRLFMMYISSGVVIKIYQTEPDVLWVYNTTNNLIGSTLLPKWLVFA